MALSSKATKVPGKKAAVRKPPQVQTREEGFGDDSDFFRQASSSTSCSRGGGGRFNLS
jgi:hypothetical protein